MKSFARSIRLQISMLLALILLLIGSATVYELRRAQDSYLEAARLRTSVQAQVFAEYALATLKRLDQTLLDLRSRWDGNTAHFAELARDRQAQIGDIAFQFIVADATGVLVFSSLKPISEHIEVQDRAYFRFHCAPDAPDRLFINPPILGRISQRWAIQMSRAIPGAVPCNGVLAISINPNVFTEFATKLHLGPGGTVTMVRDSGEIMARYPNHELHVGKTLTDTPLLEPDAPQSGSFHRIALLDGVERIFGFYKLSDYQLNFVVGEAVNDVLEPYFAHRRLVIGAASVASALVLLLIGLLFSSLRARERAVAARRQIETQQRLLSTAVAQSSASIVMTNTAGNIIFVNDAFTRTTGYSRNEALGQNPRLLQSGATPSATYQSLWNTIMAGQTWQGELLNKKKNGELYWESASISPVTDDTGQITHFIAVKEDISARKHDQEQLSYAKEQAEAASRAKSQFLATMSHEIRTPMNSILGMAQLLLTPDLSMQKQQDYIRTLLNSGQTLLTLLNDILDLSKVEAGRLELVPTAFSPAQVIHETAALFAEATQDKHLRLEAVWNGPDTQRYRADPIRLRQMLSNLLSNALKFTAQGFVRLEGSEVERDADQAMLLFVISDSGIGIAREQQQLLFQPFTQVDSSSTRRFGGSGLGLSIVRSLAQLMGGEAGVDSEIGHGARFWIRIRAEVLAAGQEPEQNRNGSETGAQDGSAQAGSSASILVVEDNPVNRKVVEAMLTRLGHRARSVADGQAAVETLTDGATPRPDLVLMDCQMPVMDGFTATTRIRAWEAAQQQSRLPIVALTASAFQEDRDRCQDAGMDDFLSKPVSLDDLRTLLERWLAPANAVPTTPIVHTPEATPIEDPHALRPLDLDQLRPLAAEIETLLARNRFNALKKFRMLQELTAGSAVEADIADIGRQVSALQFEAALERWRPLARAQGWIRDKAEKADGTAERIGCPPAPE